jgi:very-short-patch-repair endonuclease
MGKATRDVERSLRKVSPRAEDILWEALRSLGLAGLGFERRVPFLHYTVDFVCFERRLIVEMRGAHHRLHMEGEASRARAFEHHGFAVLRFTNSDVRNDLDTVRLRILTAAGVAAGQPHPRPLSRSGEAGR